MSGELRDAIGQIAEIRQQLARSEVYRGYQSRTSATTGIAALLFAAGQSWVLPGPTRNLAVYLAGWLGLAMVGLAVTALQMWHHAWQSRSWMGRQKALVAAEQFLPSLVVGALVTVAIAWRCPEAGWMLPGLWALTFALGIVASLPLLPRAIYWVVAYYMMTGAICLGFARDEHALAPWTMALTFGGGQLLTAAILHWKLERDA